MFLKSISDDVRFAQLEFRKHTKVKRLVLGSLLACMATVLQAAGGFLPGIGYFISPFATLPILIGAMFSIQMGVMSYFLTILLLFILFPSEIVIFPFTTGVIGVGIGAAFSFFKKRLNIIIIGAILLTLGIMTLLYVFHFPVLGPAVSESYSFLTAGSIFIFSFLYNWLWVEMALFFFKKFKTVITW
ncbi:hypothetical protein [Psychrobacillus sp. OK032]|uniref:hypothetical protein n=1 Tax=Psychrobacillus sp. OK032 TaxID=1884358 RepID=UPI0008C48874|nr:hypothetical protein [Psychrobacillus sp. OK032]SES38003.1 hypothetical protein SAMN05518872_109125 [Psychrobacillus sp. OK032]